MPPNNHLQPKYLHMLPGDVFLWEKFLEKYGEYYNQFEYDIHVGRADKAVGPQPEEIRKVAEAVLLKRIDAVGYHEEEVWIFEVKPDAGLSALGQLLGYKALWVRDRGLPVKLRVAVISDYVSSDDRYLFEHYEVRVFLV